MFESSTIDTELILFLPKKPIHDFLFLLIIIILDFSMTTTDAFTKKNINWTRYLPLESKCAPLHQEGRQILNDFVE